MIDVIISGHKKNHTHIEHWEMKNYLRGEEKILSPCFRDEIETTLCQMF